jgi:DNA-binding MarR family transcriptional regulator
MDHSLRGYCGYNMKRAFHVIQGNVNAALMPFELRMVTFSILSIICATPGLRQSQLADGLAIERPNIVPLLDELGAKGFTRRQRACDDRRAYELHPTKEGSVVCARARAAVADHDKRITAGLTKAQQKALVAALKLIEKNGVKDQRNVAVTLSNA